MNSDQVVRKFLASQNSLVFQSSDLSLESMANMVESNAVDISPKYQRRERWTIDKQSALIESFLLNIPVPPVYLAEDEYGEYSVIDGKQRITSIFRFIKEDMRLEGLLKFKGIEGATFQELPDQLKNALRIRPYLRVVTLLKQSDPDLKYEVFYRLNTGGEGLLPQEIRNVAFRGRMNDLIFELSENGFLQQQLKTTNKNSTAYRSMVDAEYVLRFFTIREFWDKFPGNMRVAMDNYMRKNRNPKELEIDKYRMVFNDAIEVCARIWGTDAFKRPSGTNKIVQGFFDVHLVPLSFFVTNDKARLISKAPDIRDEFSNLYAEDGDLEESIRQFTSNPERVHLRISTVTNMIKDILRAT